MSRCPCVRFGHHRHQPTSEFRMSGFWIRCEFSHVWAGRSSMTSTIQMSLQKCQIHTMHFHISALLTATFNSISFADAEKPCNEAAHKLHEHSLWANINKLDQIFQSFRARVHSPSPKEATFLSEHHTNHSILSVVKVNW